MGKTTLLNWLRQHIGKEKERSALPSRVRAEGPISRIEEPGGIDSLFRKKSILSKFTVVEVGIKHVRSRLALHEEKRYSELIERVVRQTRTSPLVVMIDEAHELSGKQIQRLFSITQDSRNQGGAVIVAMAGTPQLTERLSDSRATFVERAKRIDVGPLARSASREAIAAPLRDFGGIEMTEEALAAVVEHSQQYPYFLQLWGKELWDHAMAESQKTLGVEDVEKCEERVWEERGALYERRYGLWQPEERRFLIEIGRRINLGAQLDRERLEEIAADFLATEGGDPGKAHCYVTKAINEGVLWKRQKDEVYRLDIPSFVGYLASRGERQEQRREEERGIAG